ncbi:hypothetical protein DCF79_04765 [Edwardsiella tarda]|uniref:Uncharacterized protein n=1 Tax=Edwardsiella tarda ATCC 15947 = NBRC 105688 TaxID=667121 RepID=A0AC61TFG5_EDWTA|nr:hypothetical protein [Edwardsiella tarda]UAL57487.1 hypothetical protein K8O98_06130 [Edwardsiella tarda]UCP99453.1 hypothetical protein DCL27_12385 [Edwardsiella tarda ATCC 15947 = NBRC 105688]UCQ18741.1 hypothetical protein DCF79_04765 [Edwardsiella tarda]STD30339.1 Uncharacterised protein [Edwardsiella tarda]
MRKLILLALCSVSALASTSVMARELAQSEKQVIMDVVNSRLKDPYSAKYTWQDYKGGETYCAWVNSKNSYGGYVGNQVIIMDVRKDNLGKIVWAQGGLSDDPISYPICTDDGYRVKP